MDSSVLLGLIQRPLDPDSASPVDFRSSVVGGRPLWIKSDATNNACAHMMISSKQVECAECGQVMVLLLQMYAPDEDKLHERVLYVFCCTNSECTHKRFRVYRAQMNINHACASVLSVCAVCGLKGDFRCSQCQQRRYCSRQHQRLDWAMHRQACGSSSGEKKEVQFGLARHLVESQWEEDLIEEKEAEAEEKVDKDLSQSLSAALSLNNKQQPKEQEWDEEPYERSACHVDKTFLRFQKRIQIEPSQILRYARTDKDAPPPLPLWVNDADRPLSVPACELCGSERTFEFQIMPQLLHYVGGDACGLDFGTVVVYSCDASCDLGQDGEKGSGGLVEEFIWKQDYSKDSVDPTQLLGEVGR